ncbi:hypothetical protein [Spiroplasma endosymbiont of Ammophila pubescens]|uniref:hypothetical protein n=1 Tax=Spiroplasma endosymbiont of Ammophila pubescens TaxID=3066315 RepID=UPI0032B17908
MPSTKDRDSLLKLIGTIKFNTYNYLLDENFNKKTKWIAPIFTKSVVKNMENLSKYNDGCIWEYEKDNNLTYQYGKGWKYNNEKISNHLRDAIIIANYDGKK